MFEPKFAFLQQTPSSDQKIFLHSSMDLHFDQRTSCYSFYTKVALSWYKNQEPEITPEHHTTLNIFEWHSKKWLWHIIGLIWSLDKNILLVDLVFSSSLFILDRLYSATEIWPQVHSATW